MLQTQRKKGGKKKKRIPKIERQRTKSEISKSKLDGERERQRQHQSLKMITWELVESRPRWYTKETKQKKDQRPSLSPPTLPNTTQRPSLLQLKIQQKLSLFSSISKGKLKHMIQQKQHSTTFLIKILWPFSSLSLSLV